MPAVSPHTELPALEQMIVYMTAESHEEAERIGRILVEERLAACVNIFQPMTSIFRWQGEVQSEAEVAFIAKTSSEAFAKLRERVKDLHSYDTPCIVALPIWDGNYDFLTWINDQTKGD